MGDESQDLTRQFLLHVAKLGLEKAFRELSMTTGIEIGGAIKSLGAAVSLAKTVMEVAKKIDNAELIRAIADLNLEMATANLGMADLTNQLAELKHENGQLKEKIRKLEESAKPERQLSIGEDGLYYNATGDGPFCTGCFDKDGKTIRLQLDNSSFRRLGKYKCPSCRMHFGK
jgi:gas vesicle protein